MDDVLYDHTIRFDGRLFSSDHRECVIGGERRRRFTNITSCNGCSVRDKCSYITHLMV